MQPFAGHATFCFGKPLGKKKEGNGGEPTVGPRGYRVPGATHQFGRNGVSCTLSELSGVSVYSAHWDFSLLPTRKGRRRLARRCRVEPLIAAAPAAGSACCGARPRQQASWLRRWRWRCPSTPGRGAQGRWPRRPWLRGSEPSTVHTRAWGASGGGRKRCWPRRAAHTRRTRIGVRDADVLFIARTRCHAVRGRRHVLMACVRIASASNWHVSA